MFKRLISSGIATAVLLTTAPAPAQQAATAPDPFPPPAASLAPLLNAPSIPGAAAAMQPAPPSAAAEAAIDRRIRLLRARLGITSAQLPLWSAFAHAMREDAQSTDALAAQRAAAVARMNAADNMNSYARIVCIHASNTERLADAFDRLYASLSATQKRAADELLRRTATAPPARR